MFSFQLVAHVAQTIFDLKSKDWQNSGEWGHPCPMDTFLVYTATLDNAKQHFTMRSDANLVIIYIIF
jgi:hypothetical protein